MASPSKRFKLDVQFEVMQETHGAKFRKDFPPYVDGLVKTVPGNYVTTPVFSKNADDIYNLKPRPDDVYVLTFPKCGTTWMQELVWLVVNNCDFAKAKSENLSLRSPFLEMNYLLPKQISDRHEREAIVRVTKMPILAKFIEMLSYWNLTDVLRPVVKKGISWFIGDLMRDLEGIDEMDSPRVIKSHMPFFLLNPTLLDTSKVIYVARNPKDVIVSYYHYHRLLDFHHFTGDLETFADYFITDRLYSSPFFPQVLDAWNKRHHPNMCFVFYEDLKKDLRGQIERIAKFLGKEISAENVDKLAEHLRFDNFKKNGTVNNEIGKELGFMKPNGDFIRKGKTGDWKNHFSPELNRRIDEWMRVNLEGTDLTFVTELDEQD